MKRLAPQSGLPRKVRVVETARGKSVTLSILVSVLTRCTAGPSSGAVAPIYPVSRYVALPQNYAAFFEFVRENGQFACIPLIRRHSFLHCS